MKAIEITNINREPTYREISYTMRFPVPPALLLNGVPYKGIANIVRTYDYTIEQEVIGGNTTTYIVKSDAFSLTGIPTLNSFKTAIVAKYNAAATVIANINLKPFDTLLSGYYDGSTWII